MVERTPVSGAPNTGLYRRAFEHDSCGVTFVVDMKGRRSHSIVEQGLRAVCNLEHRGAQGADPLTGDGAGILLQMPDRFFRDVVDFDLPPEGHYATGMAFLPQEPDQADAGRRHIEAIIESEGREVLGWREVPIDPSGIGAAAISSSRPTKGARPRVIIPQTSSRSDSAGLVGA